MSKVSIVVPIYGVEHYIERCAASLFNQSYKDIEYVFVNDGTKDNSMSVLNNVINSHYNELKGQIKIINKENAGLPQARKTGIEHSAGDYILHVDSDDWLEENAVEILMKRAEETGADLIYFNFTYIYNNKFKKSRYKYYSSCEKGRFIRDIINVKTYGSVWSKFVKRELYTNYDFFYPYYGIAEDRLYSIQLLNYASSISFEPCSLYYYDLRNPESMLKSSRKKRRYEYAMNFLELYDYYKDKDYNPLKGNEDSVFYTIGFYFDNKCFDDKELGEKLLKAKLSTGLYINIFKQIILKIKAFIFILKNKLWKNSR